MQVSTQYSSRFIRAALLGGTAIAFVAATPAMAQGAADDDSANNEIIVTAQKREQSIQDVPIAVTSLGSDAMEANKIEDVADLTGLVPGLVMRNTAGSVPGMKYSV